MSYVRTLEWRKRMSDRRKNEPPTHLIHGLSDTKFGRAFYGITRRCSDKNAAGYENYGGRGIKCEWKTLVEFRNDMYASYLKHIKKFGEKNTSIDRENNDGNYCKKNCRWAVRKTQNRNQRSNHLITYKGKTQCVSAWAEEIGMKYFTLRARIDFYGYSIEEALTEPLNDPYKRKPR